MEYSALLSRRLLNEIKMLTTDPKVPSYFHYESLEPGKQEKTFYIHGYFLPRLEPYKYGSFKVCITIPMAFPFEKPQLELLTSTYHPAVSDDLSNTAFGGACCYPEWRPTTHITQWIEHCVNVIDRPEAIETYCMKNPEAKQLYNQNKVEYEKKVIALIEKYSYPRANQSIISLKFTAKQIIRKQVNFDSTKINQLPLSTTLKQYLNPSLNKI